MLKKHLAPALLLCAGLLLSACGAAEAPGSAQSQVIVELSDGSAVRLSKFEYLTPDKKSMTDLGGDTPDIASYQIEDSDLDVQLEAAKDALH